MDFHALLPALIGTGAVFLGVLAVKTFQLRQWKDPLYHLVAGTAAITVHQYLVVFGVGTGVVMAVVDTVFAVLVAVGIYRIGVAAKTVGA